jgi:dihydroorotase
VGTFDANAKMKPPLRTREDLEAVLVGLRDGTIDAIATDHAPHHRDEKEVEFECAANGIVGLETALPLVLRLLETAGLSVETVVAALSSAPARILGVECGRLEPGGLADVTVIDPNRSWQVDPSRFRSKSRNTPFAGWEMQGAAVATIVGGRVVWRAEAPVRPPGRKRGAKP